MAELFDPAQAAWAQWVSKQWMDRTSIEHARRAFMAGWQAATEQEKERQT